MDPATSTTKTALDLPVSTGLEDGLLGIALDPKFATNGWVYLFDSPRAPRSRPAPAPRASR